MADLQRDQLLKGLTSKDEKIVPKYAWAWYAKMKSQMNPLAGTGTPDLKLTGSFHNSIKYKVQNKVIQIIADDPNGLEGRYRDIFGLGKNARVQLIDSYLQKTVSENVKRELNK